MWSSSIMEVLTLAPKGHKILKYSAGRGKPLPYVTTKNLLLHYSLFPITYRKCPALRLQRGAICVGTTYFPGQSPDKYLRRK